MRKQDRTRDTILRGKPLREKPRAPIGDLHYNEESYNAGEYNESFFSSRAAYKMYLYGGTRDLLGPHHNGLRRP